MDFNYLRRNSLFSPVQPSTGVNPNALSVTPDMMNQSGQPQQQNYTPPLQPPNPSTLTDAYREMMQAQSGPSNQRYKDFLGEGMPQREDFKPSKMNRLTAVLAGASDGIQRGGGEGYKTAQGILDEPYNEAIGDYKNKASRLEAGANLEDKETNNKVKTYRDYVTDQQNKRRDDIALQTLAETSRVNNGRLKNWESEASSRETPQQRMDRALGVAGKTAELRKRNALDIFNTEQPIRTRDAIKVAGVRGDITARNQDRKFESIKDLKQYVADNVTPDKYDHIVGKDGFVYGVNKTDPTDVIKTTIDTGKLPPDQLAALKLKNAKDLKASPGAGKTTTTKKVVSGNTATTETTVVPDDKPKTIHITLSDGRQLDIPADKLDEAKKRDPKLVVK